MLFGNNVKAKEIHPEFDSIELPVYEQDSESTWLGNIEIKYADFIGFQSATTDCSKQQHVFARNPSASDFIPIHNFVDCHFEDVTQNSVSSIDPPNAGWSATDECGGSSLICTAPNNIILKFTGTSYGGTTPSSALSNWEIVSAPTEAGDTLSTCVWRAEWNAYWCGINNELAYLRFESLDDDRYSRKVAPVTITKVGSTYENIVSHFRDHQIIDSLYYGTSHLSRFYAVLQADAEDYIISMAGTVPDKMRFNLENIGGVSGIKVIIPYSTAGDHHVYINGVK